MKTRLISVLFVLAVAGAVCFGMSKQQGGQGPNYHDNCIDFPGTPITQPQLGKIIQRLQKGTKYPENYRIVVWDKGKQTRSIGQMKIDKASEASIDKAEVSKADVYAKSSGLTALTYRVGQCPTGAVCDPKCGPPTLKDSKQLVEEVTKILKSY